MREIDQIIEENLIVFNKNGTIESIRAPDFGTVVIKFKNNQPYDVEVTNKLKII
ncbi:TPA: hypothetical protein ACGO62_000306 [Streptococcus suis]